MTEALDPAFLPLAEFVEESASIEGQVIDQTMGTSMTIDTVEMSMPVELDLIVDDAGRVLLGTIPPLYYVDTTVVPVYHQITLTLQRTDLEDDGE
jgi:hypothetical protein